MKRNFFLFYILAVIVILFMPAKSFSNSNDNKSSSTHINKKDEPVKAKKDTTRRLTPSEHFQIIREKSGLPYTEPTFTEVETLENTNWFEDMISGVKQDVKDLGWWNLPLLILLLILFILAYFFLRYIKRKRLIKAQIKPVEPPTIPQPTIEKATSIDTSGLKFCIQCGKQIHGSSKFCPHCGAEQW